MRAPLLFVLLLSLLAACSVQFSTANIQKAVLAKDEAGLQLTSDFEPGDTFYCLVTLANALEGTKLKAAWTAVSAAGVENHPLDAIEVETATGTVPFKLSFPEPWPVGEYQVEIFLDGKLDRTIPFKVLAP